MRQSIAQILTNLHLKACFVGILSIACLQAHATTVQFQTSLGDFEVNLYDDSTPATVANFLAYVNAGAYTNVMVHRSVPDFVVQAGGFTLTDNVISPVPTFDSVVNEPIFSSVAGTIAMAKVGGNPNSATNQWFFSLKNNSQTLDAQNGGFTVFGEIVGNGLAIVQTIAGLPHAANTTTFGQNYPEAPLQNLPADIISEENIVFVRNIVVLDAATDTAAGLDPVKNTLLNPPNNGSSSSAGSGGGGGSFGFSALFLLLGFTAKRYLKRK